MNMGTSLVYQLPGGAGEVAFSVLVLRHFRAHRQLKCWSNEAGGQLFADLSAPGRINVTEATGPRASDRRSPITYHPDRSAERREILDRYARNLHFLGDWHTHRQNRPLPSSTDIESMAEMFRESEHDFPGFLLVVVGKIEGPDGLHVSYHTREGWTQIHPVAEPDVIKSLQEGSTT